MKIVAVKYVGLSKPLWVDNRHPRALHTVAGLSRAEQVGSEFLLGSRAVLLGVGLCWYRKRVGGNVHLDWHYQRQLPQQAQDLRQLKFLKHSILVSALV